MAMHAMGGDAHPNISTDWLAALFAGGIRAFVEGAALPPIPAGLSRHGGVDIPDSDSDDDLSPKEDGDVHLRPSVAEKESSTKRVKT